MGFVRGCKRILEGRSYLTEEVRDEKNSPLKLVVNKTAKLITLDKSLEFKNIKKQGRRFQSTSWVVFYYRPNSLPFSRFGWSLSRLVANAVVRNKIKRWCRVQALQYLRKNMPPKHYDIHIVFRRKSKDFYNDMSYVFFRDVF